MAADTAVAELLLEADTLESAGRPTEAIALLTDANRTVAAAPIEQRLVTLRARSFDVIDRTSGLDTWPRVAPDPFPDVVGRAPEIHRSELDASLLAGAIGHHGLLIVRDLIGPAEVERLRDAVERSFDARDARKANRLDPADAGWFSPFEEGTEHTRFPSKRFVRIIDSPRALYVLLEVYADSGLLGIVEEHLGERPALSAHKCALRRLAAEPGERSTDYHQDGAFLGDGIRTVNVWLALTPCGGELAAPAVDVVPKRIDHILDTGVDGAHLDWTVSENVVARAAAGIPIERPRFDAGDAMLFDELMVHRTALDDRMTDERMAVESWFFAPSVYPPDHVPLLV
jgi:hypothetical protein